MNTQKHCTIRKYTSKDEGELTLVPTDKESGVHVPVNHLKFNNTKSNYWDQYYYNY